jgi:Skp family chaperone for outer membrane proteins
MRLTPLLLVVLVTLAFAQAPQDTVPVAPPANSNTDVRLPNGKSQRDEILKAEHAENLKDAAKLVDMAQDLRESLEKDDRYVLSLATLKKTEDIEKLVKKIRTRLRHD